MLNLIYCPDYSPNKTVVNAINDTNENVGPANADKQVAINECNIYSRLNLINWPD